MLLTPIEAFLLVLSIICLFCFLPVKRASKDKERQQKFKASYITYDDKINLKSINDR